MAEYIEREAVIDLVTSRYENPEICTAEINSIQAADVAPVVHGRWESQVVRKPFVQVLYKCSKCGYLVDRVSNYCPNCGAKMDGGDNDA